MMGLVTFLLKINSYSPYTCAECGSRTHILDYLSHLAGLGRSGVTRTRKLAAIREYCKFLVNEKLLAHSPTENIVGPKQERKQRVFLLVDEYMRLLYATAECSRPRRQPSQVDEYMRLLYATAGNSRDYAILQLFLQTGIRVAELVGLQLIDIDLNEGAMLINGKGNKQRTIYLEKKATQALRAYLSNRPQATDQHVFLNYQG